MTFSDRELDPRDLGPLLERLLETVATGVVVCDMTRDDAPIVYVNDHFETLTGYPAAEALGRNCRFLQGEGSGEHAVRLMREAIARGSEATAVVLNYRRDGSSFWNEVRLAPVTDGTVPPRYYLGLITDVTARVQAESSLAHTEVLQSTALDSLVEGVLVLDTTTAATYVNPSALAILGVTREQLQRDDWWAPLHVRTPDGQPVELADSPGIVAFAQRRRLTDVQLLVRRGDGSDRLISFNYTPIADPSADRPQGMVVTLRDETERRRAEEELQQFATLVEISDDLIVITALDGSLRYLNPAGRRLIGVQETDDLAQLEFRDLVTDEGWRSITDVQRPAVRAHGYWKGESTLRHLVTGEVIPVRVSSYVVRHPQTRRALAIASVQRDISEERRITADLIASRARHEAHFRSLPLPTYVWQLVDGEFVLADWNAAAEAPERNFPNVRGETARQRYVELPEVYRAIERCGATQAPVILDASYRPRPDAELVHVTVTCAWVPPDTVLVHSLDITERVRFERQLVYAAEHDDLTGLHNRRYFEQRLSEQLGHSRLSVLLVDIDHFKFVNDSLGHQAGDELLREVAGTMEHRLRDGDVLARFGGDEFAVLLPDCDTVRARAVAGHLLAAIRSSVTGVSVTASAGAAVFTADAEIDASEAIVAADIGLYEAKQHGRDRVEVYAGQAGESLTWLQQIRAAIEQDRLVLYGQPVIALREPAGPSTFEALVRMRGESGELIPPGSFLPTAEQFGLIRDIDRWVIAQGIAFAARGHRVSINLSARSIADRELPGVIAGEIAGSGARPQDIMFEFTETAAVSSVEDARVFTRTLLEMGCQAALDDFGTGFATFVLLKHLPVTTLKIDAEFVRNLSSSADDQRIVRAIVQIACDAGMQTVAEGVEDAGTLALLREYGVSSAQGYHIARPGPLPE